MKLWLHAVQLVKHTFFLQKTSQIMFHSKKNLNLWIKNSTRYSCTMKTTYQNNSGKITLCMRLHRNAFLFILFILGLIKQSIKSCNKKSFANCVKITSLKNIAKLKIPIFVSVAITLIIIIDWGINTKEHKFLKNQK